MLTLTAGALLLPSVAGRAQAASPQAKAGSGIGRDMPFDDGWRFHRGAGDGFEAALFDDSHWRQVDLPHDWSIEDVPGGKAPDQLGPFSKAATGGTAAGFAEGGEGWYRKRFSTAGFPSDAQVELLFDGVYTDCDVWLNGAHLGQHLHGYAPFAFNLTPHLVRGGDNVLAVRARNLGKNRRWYSGSGIYRQVSLDVLPPGSRFARWGIGAWTRRIEGGRAELEVTSRINAADSSLELVTRLRDPSGRVVAEAAAPAAAEAKQTLVVRGPRLWSTAEPNLYSLESELRRGDAVIDRMVQPFGIRIVTMDTARGLQINGQRVVLRGGCVHHDNGLLGACAYPDADERRIRLLKARGFNAIRSSHNPASRSLRGACDRIGMLMIEEAFDMWHAGKNDDDYHTHFRSDWQGPLTAMVLAARNSPSVIMWSVGNEIPERSQPEGLEWSWKLANTVRGLDPTRPVTAALNGLLGPLVRAGPRTARPGQAGKVDNASSIFLDVAGYNYRLEDVEVDHAEHPDRIMFGTETFPKEAWDYVQLTERAPYFLGEFVWTALDYLGEAGIGAGGNQSPGGLPMVLAGWPWVVSWCGDLDLIGDQKQPSRFRDVAWGLSKLEIGVHRPIPEGQVEVISSWGWPDELPSWTWAGVEGKPLTVRVYTPGDRVELWLNGAKVGEAAVTPADKLRAEIKVAYAPGTLEAIAYKSGKVIGRRRLETVTRPAKLRLRPESPQMGAGRQDLGYVAVDVLDSTGRLIPQGDVLVSLAIDGPAELAGFGSANPLAVGSFQSTRAMSFRGRALAILRGTGRKGTVRLTAGADGMESAVTSLRVA
jgi:beta-galactosidase